MSNNFHLQLYRGTTAQNDAYTGLSGEVTVDTTLSKLRLHDGSTAGGVEIGGMPVGSIIPYAGTTIPAGYLLCDGSAISRTTYSALFAAIGTTYGAGDGNSTFNIPAIDNGDTPLGITTSIQLFGQYTHGSVPNITGHISTAGSYGAETFTSEGITYSGAFWIDNQTGWRYNTTQQSAGKYTDLHIDASRSSNLYQNNESDIKACGVYMFYIIKY